MWDVWIHILGIVAECACLEGGRPSVPPLRRKHGKPGRRALQSGLRATGGWGHPPLRRSLGEKRRAHNVRPYTAVYERLYIQEEGQVWDLSLKTQRRSGASQKVLLPTFLSRKVGYTGPWRKRSIISWVREMADPPWGRFSRSNQVPSPNSSSWRVTVSSSVSRSQ